ncbi:MAG: cytochrome c maturation protein CcmE [Armatimonadota bacterium]|nr:cytochrome c maturation protein CcmE [Armatimonadota bacterium]
MTTKRKLLIGSVIIVLALGFVAYQGVRSSMVYYLTPTEFKRKPELRHNKIRMAGKVVLGSVAKSEGHVRFEITDGITPYRVSYTGPLPDLFAEGREVLVEGRVDDAGVIQAAQVISTHPPEYKAPEH